MTDISTEAVKAFVKNAGWRHRKESCESDVLRALDMLTTLAAERDRHLLTIIDLCIERDALKASNERLIAAAETFILGAMRGGISVEAWVAVKHNLSTAIDEARK